MHFCCRKAKNSCFAPKTLIYGIFVANVAKNTTQQRFEDTILRKLANEDKPQVCRPAYHTGNMKVCKTMRARPKKLFLLRLCSFAIFPWTWTNEGVSHQDQEKEMLNSCCRSSNSCKYCDYVSAPDPKPLWTQIWEIWGRRNWGLSQGPSAQDPWLLWVSTLVQSTTSGGPSWSPLCCCHSRRSPCWWRHLRIGEQQPHREISLLLGLQQLHVGRLPPPSKATNTILRKNRGEQDFRHRRYFRRCRDAL